MSLPKVKQLGMEIMNTFDRKNITHEEFDKGLEALGRFNACAYKGYGVLSGEERSYNDEIYAVKDAALRKAVDIAVDRGWDVSADLMGRVIYFRLEDGRQISFHTGKYLTDEWERVMKSLPKGKWDEVKKAWDKTSEEYRSKRGEVLEYNRQIAERYSVFLQDVRDWQEMTKEFVKEFFSSGSVRERMGIDMSRDELNDYIDKIPMRIGSNAGGGNYDGIHKVVESLYSRFPKMSYGDRDSIIRAFHREYLYKEPLFDRSYKGDIKEVEDSSKWLSSSGVQGLRKRHVYL